MPQLSTPLKEIESCILESVDDMLLNWNKGRNCLFYGSESIVQYITPVCTFDCSTCEVSIVMKNVL